VLWGNTIFDQHQHWAIFWVWLADDHRFVHVQRRRQIDPFG